MSNVTTIALLERKTGITRSLFTRYWRDVHGVMAARIPGFESYTQHHVTPLDAIGSDRPGPFEGVAVVTFADESRRQGLVDSEITRHIHRDERNVFRRALLYNLDSGASQVLVGSSQQDGYGVFLVIPGGLDAISIGTALVGAGAMTVHVHDLTGGDPSGWNNTDIGEGDIRQTLSALIQTVWTDVGTALAAIRSCVASSSGAITAYGRDESHVMVRNGRPTPVGLRGLDAVRTIEEAGATNQLEEAVVSAIYGRFGAS